MHASWNSRYPESLNAVAPVAAVAALQSRPLLLCSACQAGSWSSRGSDLKHGLMRTCVALAAQRARSVLQPCVAGRLDLVDACVGVMPAVSGLELSLGSQALRGCVACHIFGSSDERCVTGTRLQVFGSFVGHKPNGLVAV